MIALQFLENFLKKVLSNFDKRHTNAAENTSYILIWII